MSKKYTYKNAGVDVEKADKFVDIIKKLTKSKEIGKFSGLYEIDFSLYKNPVLVSSTDGVGTKLKIAQAKNIHNTVGIDLVAMCANDILCLGAKPLFFLDYLSFGKLNLKIAEELIKGIIKGCEEAECILLGGETAEMPGFYSEGEYDMAGFIVGIVEKDKIIDGSKINSDDIVLGLASSGLHSNGYSLVRKLFLEDLKFSLDEEIPELKAPLYCELLKPTKIYVKYIFHLLRKIEIKGIAHITGGGFYINIPRILPKNLGVEIFEGSWEIPPIFLLIKKLGNISHFEMFKTFNMGIGMIIIISEKDKDIALNELKNLHCKAFVIGKVKEQKEKIKFV